MLTINPANAKLIFDERHRPTRPTLKLMHKTYDVDYYSTVLDKICLGRDRRLVKRLIIIFIIFPFFAKMQFFKISIISCFSVCLLFSPAKFFQPPLDRFAPNLARMCLSDLGRKRRGRFWKSSKTR